MVLAAEGKAVLRMARCGVETSPDDPGSSSLLVRRFHRALTPLEGPIDVRIQTGAPICLALDQFQSMIMTFRDAIAPL